MNLFTKVDIPTGIELSYTDQFFFLGSCFGTEISKKLAYFGYSVSSNPFGTVYNSSAIREQLNSIHKQEFDANTWLVEGSGEVVSLLHNTEFRANNQDELLDRINLEIRVAHQQIKKASFISITLGTAQVFRYQKNNTIVANCQKLSNRLFTKELQSPDQIFNDLLAIQNSIRSVNERCIICFTISPVRYLSDGMQMNQISKSHLFTALHRYFTKFPETSYFPSYEIVLDELRDYRYFAKDLVHVNELGVEYIWQRMNSNWFSKHDLEIQNRVNQFRKLERHQASKKNREQHWQQVESLRQTLQNEFKVHL